MPSKKWQTSRSISSKEARKSRGKGSGLTDKGKRRRPGTPPQTLALPILSNPVLQRSNSRASSRYTASTVATLLHSRALRPTSPAARATSPRNLRPRSRSLPVPQSTFPGERKRLRRLTLANTSSISRVLFDCDKKEKNKEKENAVPTEQGTVEENEQKSIPAQKASPISQIVAEMKTPDFHSSTAMEDSPHFALPPAENKDHPTTHVLSLSGDATPEDNNCEIRLAKRFDVLLPFAGPPTRFVGIDIDDTLVVTNHSPSILLTSCGVTTFQRYVHQKFTDFKTKNALCRELEKAIKDKVLVEPNIPSVIRDLQDSGCWVFGVTARYHEMAASTDKCLNSLGINLSATSPFPSQLVRDPKTGAVCVNGIIYCNGLSKGNILNRFFENVVLRSVLTSNSKGRSSSSPSCSSIDTKASSPATIASTINKRNRPDNGLPERFIFIDDQRSQAECISKDLICARTLNIPVTCFHYVPEILRDPCENMDRRQRGQILLKQMMHFIDKKTVLSNQEALQLIKSSCPQQSPRLQPQPQHVDPDLSSLSKEVATTSNDGGAREFLSSTLRQNLSGIPTGTPVVTGSSSSSSQLKRDTQIPPRAKMMKLQGVKPQGTTFQGR